MRRKKIYKLVVSVLLAAFLFSTSINTYTIKSAGLDSKAKADLLASSASEKSQDNSGYKTDRFIIKYKSEKDVSEVKSFVKDALDDAKELKGKEKEPTPYNTKREEECSGYNVRAKAKEHGYMHRIYPAGL